MIICVYTLCMYTVHIHRTRRGGRTMLYGSNDLERQVILQAGARMCAAARTAPKAHGKDTLHTFVLTGKEKEELAQKMEEVGKREMG